MKFVFEGYIYGAVAMFVTAAAWQLFLPRHLPNALVYCLCAWILSRVRNSL